MFVLLLAMNVLQMAYLEEVLAGLGYASLQPQLCKRHTIEKELELAGHYWRGERGMAYV